MEVGTGEDVKPHFQRLKKNSQFKESNLLKRLSSEKRKTMAFKVFNFVSENKALSRVKLLDQTSMSFCCSAVEAKNVSGGRPKALCCTWSLVK